MKAIQSKSLKVGTESFLRIGEEEIRPHCNDSSASDSVFCDDPLPLVDPDVFSLDRDDRTTPRRLRGFMVRGGVRYPRLRAPRECCSVKSGEQRVPLKTAQTSDIGMLLRPALLRPGALHNQIRFHNLEAQIHNVLCCKEGEQQRSAIFNKFLQSGNGLRLESGRREADGRVEVPPDDVDRPRGQRFPGKALETEYTSLQRLLIPEESPSGPFFR